MPEPDSVDREMDFTGRVALITGAARGQGRSHALGFARYGADVVANDICGQLPTLNYRLGTQEELDDVVEEIRKMGRRAIGVKADVGKADQVRNLVDRVIKEFGRVDIAVVNHGIYNYAKPFQDYTEQEWDQVVETNAKAFFLVSKYLIPHMIKQRYGRIIVTSSNAGFVGFWGMSNYVASKHAVVGLVRGMAIELAPYDITVNAVCPTGTDTELARAEIRENPGWVEKYITPIGGCNSLFPDRPMNQPEDVTNGVLFLAAEESRNITGTCLPVDCGYLAK